MATYDLRTYQEYAASEVKEAYSQISLRLEWMDFMNRSRSVFDSFLTLASASLLSDFKLALFFQNLHRCAENWHRFLLTSQQHYKCVPPLSFNSPMFAAILTGDHDLCMRIKDALPKEWSEQSGYREDFHIAWLHLLLLLDSYTLNEEVDAHIHALQECTDDEAKITLLKTLIVEGDEQESDYWELFEIALYDREEHVKRKVSEFTTRVRQFVPHRYIWYEGLVLLRHAINRGFTLPSSSILFCPEEALNPHAVSYSSDWLVIPMDEQS